MDNLTPLIAELSAKLGTTTQHLWGVLVRQAPINGVISLIQYAIVAGLCWAAIKATPQAVSKADEDPLWMMALLGGWAVTVILVLAVFFSIPDTVAAFLNPEYWAIEHVLDKISQAKK